MMNKKLPTWLSLAVALLVTAYYFWFHPKENSPSVPSSTSVHTADYDVNMRDDAIGQNQSAQVDYYMLALSWSPAFCDSQRKQNQGKMSAASQYQCATQNQFGWVIHGLWPQNASAKSVSDHPRFCQGDLSPLPQSLLEQYLFESPGLKLLQGEWEKHGACAFNNAEDYFKKQRELYRALTLPSEEMPRSQLFNWLKQHNKQLKGKYLNASRSELFICYDLKWRVTDCPKR